MRWSLLTAAAVALSLSACAGAPGRAGTTPAPGSAGPATTPAATATAIDPMIAPTKPAVTRPVSAQPVTHGPRRRHLVALTFDADMTRSMLAEMRSGRAGPQVDRRLFAELRATRTPATIFLTGLWTQKYPQFARGLARDSLFELENHSYDHRAWTSTCFGLPFVTTAAAETTEVTATQRAVERVTGVTPRYFRFPGGCARARDRRRVARLGLRTVGWDVVSGDAFQSDPQVIVRNVLADVRPGSIVVAHCIGAPNTPATAAAMTQIIPALRHRGYRFVTLNQLLRG